PPAPGTEVLTAAVGGKGTGVAPGARWTACVDPPGPTSDPAGYLSCLQFMHAPFLPGRDPLHDGHPHRAADVLVGSWDCAQPQPCDLVALSPAVRALTQAGMFLVSAVGTAGPRCGSI